VEAVTRVCARLGVAPLAWIETTVVAKSVVNARVATANAVVAPQESKRVFTGSSLSYSRDEVLLKSMGIVHFRRKSSLSLLRAEIYERGYWVTSSATSPTKFLDSAGKVIALEPGRTWVEIYPAGASQVVTPAVSTTTTTSAG
jgi:hypothetical protein